MDISHCGRKLSISLMWKRPNHHRKSGDIQKRSYFNELSNWVCRASHPQTGHAASAERSRAKQCVYHSFTRLQRSSASDTALASHVSVSEVRTWTTGQRQQHHVKASGFRTPSASQGSLTWNTNMVFVTENLPDAAQEWEGFLVTSAVIWANIKAFCLNLFHPHW